MKKREMADEGEAAKQRQWRRQKRKQSHTTSLSLANQQLSKIPADVDWHAALTRVDISGNELRDVAAMSRAPTSIKWFSCANNRITALSPIHHLTALEILNVSGNALAGALDVSAFGRLAAFIANNNAISALPGLRNLTRLDSLIISRNKFAQLPAGVSALKALKKLSAADNDISKMGCDVCCCSALQELRFAHNSIKKLPPKVSRLQSLKILDLGGNRVASTTSIAVLSQLTMLTNLNLRQSPLQVDTTAEEYASLLSKLLPSLRMLDGRKFGAVADADAHEEHDAVDHKQHKKKRQRERDDRDDDDDDGALPKRSKSGPSGDKAEGAVETKSRLAKAKQHRTASDVKRGGAKQTMVEEDDGTRNSAKPRLQKAKQRSETRAKGSSRDERHGAVKKKQASQLPVERNDDDGYDDDDDDVVDLPIASAIDLPDKPFFEELLEAGNHQAGRRAGGSATDAARRRDSGLVQIDSTKSKSSKHTMSGARAAKLLLQGGIVFDDNVGSGVPQWND